jgi:predicted MPP superfamily phosphohydrolase
MKISFFITALTVLISMNSFVMVRGWQALPSVSYLRPIYLTVVIIMFLAIFVGMIFGSNMPANLGKAISHVGFSYMVIFIYLFISFLLVDMVRIANYFVHFAPAGMAAFRLWVMIATLGITFVAMIIGNYKFNHPAVVTLNLSVDKPTQNKTLKIVAASDIHLGVTIDKKRLQGYVKLINDQHPDIVLLAGDVSDRSMIPIVKQHLDEDLKQIKAKFGVYAINGNHEHYAETPNATAEYLKKAGIKVLVDQVSLVDSSFYVVGRDDRSNPKRKKVKDLVTGLDSSKPKIMLDHQPFHLEEAEQNGIDLQLSGHTHNGQFFPGNLIVKRMYELGYGYKKKGKTHYYVSSGLGLWGPQYRIGTQSELVVINLKY